MRAVLVIVTNILRRHSLQMAFVHGDDVIQQVTTTTADPTFYHANSAEDFRTKFEQGLTPARTTRGISRPYLASRSKITNRGADPEGNASRNCWTVQKLVGFFVTLKCRMRRRS
jgi:hypothetical protein